MDRVVFIPAHQPPHKRVPRLLAGDVRLELVRLAIRDNPSFVASDIELQRQDVSYSLATVRSLHQQLPGAKLFLLLGQDMLSVRWMGWDEITRLCSVIVARRPGARSTRQARGLRWLDMPQVDIASSDIRRRLAAGRSIRYLVPSAVERYLQQHSVYAR